MQDERRSKLYTLRVLEKLFLHHQCELCEDQWWGQQENFNSVWRELWSDSVLEWLWGICLWTEQPVVNETIVLWKDHRTREEWG